MRTTSERIDALVAQTDALRPWVGPYDREALLQLLRLELGHAAALDGWVEHGPLRARAVPLSPVLHVVSGNTPHAAFQSVFRGLLLGCRNRVKLPSAGLPPFEQWREGLPQELQERIAVSHVLPDPWRETSQASVVYGGAETIAAFRAMLPPGIRLIEHGPKLSVAVVFEPGREAARRVAEDVLRHDQRGCLSVQAVFVAAEEEEVFRFGGLLAEALASWRSALPRGPVSLSESGAVANARELARFRMANGAGCRLWESEGSTEWTVMYDPDPALAPGPLQGFVTLHPLPDDLSRLGEEARHLSTVAIHPFTEEAAERLAALAPPRICAAGTSQDPTIFWHADGQFPLAGLVRWRDLG